MRLRSEPTPFMPQLYKQTLELTSHRQEFDFAPAAPQRLHDYRRRPR